MKTKKYKSKEKSLPEVEEPAATYGPTVANSNDIVISSLSPESLDDKPEGFDACYAKLKAEADEKFGVIIPVPAAWRRTTNVGSISFTSRATPW